MPRGDVLEGVPGVGTLWRLGTRPVGSVRAVRTAERSVVLTFDDGPVRGSTDGVLASLAEVGATATFFMLMTCVRDAPGMVAEVAAAGHEIALHGPDHARLTTFPTAEVVERTRAARVELEDLLGRPVRWFRPPYGSQTPRTWAAVRRAGLTPVLWGGTTWDWKDVPTPRRLEKAMSALAPGQIVLAHDALNGGMVGAGAPGTFTLDRGAFVRELLAEYAARGYSAVSLDAALERGGTLRRWAWFGT